MAKASIWLKLFDRERDFVANKVMILGGQDLVPGDPIDKTLVNTRRLRQMYEARKILMVEAVEAEIEHIGEEIAEGWRDLPWLPEIKGGPTIRQLAAKFTDSAIRNKDAAIAIIEAEIARREAALNPTTNVVQNIPENIPEHWKELAEADRIALANALQPGAEPITDVADADALIELEVEQRAAAVQPPATDTPAPVEEPAPEPEAEPPPAETSEPVAETSEPVAETTEETQPAEGDGQSA
ncbi:hypothetical protein EN781_00155 [Mesorhizobium sp. M4A.F.Ca.ET.090.04.2.1]|uniref:hypothetical protein n=1 Tax=Mesorhizobium sp. M4A.F.Ca.ET.090.04.2.1 TaxID=2496663 RepID=UPI000FCBA6BC|nr:hypothetical protein [Mesorhizobium sp. M4A.F.Ca.ET.090.04.2.1]RVC47584.1 hypothetical protein EN781_00155 [Mesorhizobium sp. M4A.F.Ca.ET.090.04.2.1]